MIYFCLIFILAIISKIFNDRTMFINISLLVLGYILYKYQNYLMFILLGMYIFIMNEILYYFIEGIDTDNF